MPDILNFNILTFIPAVGFLGLWFLFSQSRKLSLLFGLIFFAFLASNFAVNFLNGFGPLKYLYFSKNLILLGVFGVIFKLFKRNKIALILSIAGSIFLCLQIFNIHLPPKLMPADLQKMMEKGELLVEVELHNIDEIQNLLEPQNGSIIKAFSPEEPDMEIDKFYIIDLPDEYSPNKTKLLKELYARDLITYGEYNDEVSVAPLESTAKSTPSKNLLTNDPLASQQWALNALDAKKLHQLIIRNQDKIKRKIKVAVLDTGIESNHEDLQNAVTSNNSDNGTDPVGHGTHCAGIIGARTNNHKGISSFAFYDDIIELQSIKVLNSFGFGTQAKIIEGMIEAVDDGADVLSLSLGGISDNAKQLAYKAAVDYARQKNVAVIVSAGNSSSSAGGFTPANVEGVFCISAIDENMQLASFSNHVEDIPWGFSAPGVNILSTFKNNSYKSLNGTSMAAPYVSSTVAILKAFHPELTPEGIFEILKFTSIPTKNKRESGPLIQPASALEALLNKMEYLN